MLQTALDLSKQWPQALARVGLGAAFFMVTTNIFFQIPTGLERNMSASSSFGAEDSLILVFALFFVGVCYLFGSLLMAIGEIQLTAFDNERYIRLVSGVFETQNGFLIQEFQETRRLSQLLGGLMATVFFGGWITIAKSLFYGEPFALADRLFGSDFKYSGAHYVSILVGLVVSIVIFVGLYSRIRSVTVQRLEAIEAEAKRLNAGPLGRPRSEEKVT